MKKTATLLLLLSLFLGLFLSACGGGSSEKEISPSSEEEGTIDFAGESFTILQTEPVNSPFCYAEKTILADRVMDHLETREKEMNCSFSFSYVASESMPAFCSGRSATGMYYADIVFSTASWKMREVAKAGNFVPIDDVMEILDVHDHEKWGTVEILEAMMCKGVLYAVSPQTWINLISIPWYTLVYNRDLVVTEFNMKDPHELYESKTWTRDVLENYILTCTATEEGVTTVYGIAAAEKHLVRQAILSNGCEMVVIDGDGNLSCGWTSSDAVEALVWASKLMREHKDSVSINNGPSDWDSNKTFDENRASFLLTKQSIIFDEVAYAVKDFGLMPWPSGPNMPYGEWIGYYETIPAISIPTTCKDSEWGAMAIDRIFEPMDDYPTFDSIKNYYATNVLHDALDVEILFENRNNPLTHYSYWEDGGDGFLQSIQSLSQASTSSAAQKIEQNKASLERVIEAEIYPNRLAIDKYR